MNRDLEKFMMATIAISAACADDDMTPIEQAKALAEHWREEGKHWATNYAAKARETAELLEKLAAELERA